MIIYAVEKPPDSYKFNLLHNKQLFINQLKANSLGKRTIDEGGMDEQNGLNFSEYVAILSGNTDCRRKPSWKRRLRHLKVNVRALLRNMMKQDSV